MMQTKKDLISQLRQNATLFPNKIAVTYVEKKRVQSNFTYAALMHSVDQCAHMLREQNLVGVHVGLLFPTGTEFVIAFLGCLAAGVVAVPLNYTFNSKQFERLSAIVEDAGITVMLTDQKSHQLVKDGTYALKNSSVPMTWISTFEPVSSLPLLTEDAVQSDAVAFIQYTSGSTDQPKGVQISHLNIMSNIHVIVEACRFDGTIIGGGWLPHFHDMGLIGQLLTPLALSGRIVLMSPMEFIQRPNYWIWLLSHFQCTATLTPNFGLDYCVKKLSHEAIAEYDLSCLRAVLVGSEPVVHATLQKFAALTFAIGFDRSAFVPCYGLAEATLMVSGSVSVAHYDVVQLDTVGLEQGCIIESVADKSCSLVSCGKVCPTVDIMIVSQETGQPLEELQLGEIVVSGLSVSLGYLHGRGDEAFVQLHVKSSVESCVDKKVRYFKTGDLGFVKNGQLFVVGRIKDMLIIQGKNIFPYEIESCLNTFESAFGKNGALVFEDDSTEFSTLSAFLEVQRTVYCNCDHTQLQQQVRTFVYEKIGVALHRVYFCLPGSIPRTTSGKVRRSAIDIERIKLKKRNIILKGEHSLSEA